MANLFGKNKLKSVAQAIDTDDVLAFIDIVKKWHHDYHHGTLRRDKETSREQEYNQNFFKDILGYKEKPITPFNFEPKATTEKGQLPDAVIGYTDKVNDIKNISAVVELKGAAIDLDRPQQREGNMSPVQQAFKYKTQYRNCPFVIVSNFWEFRLYRDNLLDYEAWTLDDLVNPEDDYLYFKTWYVLLKSDNFITSKGTSKTENILSDIRIEQENISKKFYKVYKDARLTLLRDIYFRNETVKKDIDMGVEKAQKIIDRIVFTCFAEDRGLLPDNTLQRVIRDAEQSSFGVSLWQAFKGLFEAVDSGSDKLEIPDGYNGGLFKHDEILDNLRISDDGLRPVVELSKYDFSEDLSVSILGHIFEQSISDLEEIKNKVNVDKNVETIVTQSRRKKDGIFYTPDYIVRYIVDNSLGTYLREHEETFKDEYKLHGDINDKNYSKREKQAYQKYQYFLQNVKVVDPACGSGAFLVYVFDYLMSENQRVGDILGNNIFSTDEYIRDILKNNIYGVDLNEESVEITKLSLWLKSAQKGKKLTSLDSNIKCGNSLIDDPNVAGDKAFNWQEQFADVFNNGGFDIVVGNPPYVSSRAQDKSTREYIKKFTQYSGGADLYVAFIEKGLSLLKDKSFMSIICPNKFFGASYGTSIRDYLRSNVSIIEILDTVDDKVFDDALISTVAIIMKKSFSQKSVLVRKGDESKIIDELYDQQGKIQIEQDNASTAIIRKISNNKKLSDFANIRTGIMGFEYWKMKDIISSSNGNNEVPLYTNGNLRRYNNNWDDAEIDLYKMKYKTPYINLNREYISANTVDFFKTNPKIIIRGVAQEVSAIIDKRGAGLLVAVHGVVPNDINNIKSMIAIINSKLINWYHQKVFYSIRIPQGSLKYPINFIESIPYPQISGNDSNVLDGLVDDLEYNIILLKKHNSSFAQIIKNEFKFNNWPTKLEKWWILSFDSFVKSLSLKLSLQQKDELIQLYEKYRTNLQQLDAEIKKTDQEIDRLVYKLYDLADDEITIIEGR